MTESIELTEKLRELTRSEENIEGLMRAIRKHHPHIEVKVAALLLIEEYSVLMQQALRMEQVIHGLTKSGHDIPENHE